jgi:hypothetical protein
MFKELARWYGVEKGVVGLMDEGEKYSTVNGRNGQETPIGYVLISSFRLFPKLLI